MFSVEKELRGYHHRKKKMADKSSRKKFHHEKLSGRAALTSTTAMPRQRRGSDSVLKVTARKGRTTGKEHEPPKEGQSFILPSDQDRVHYNHATNQL